MYGMYFDKPYIFMINVEYRIYIFVLNGEPFGGTGRTFFPNTKLLYFHLFTCSNLQMSISIHKGDKLRISSKLKIKQPDVWKSRLCSFFRLITEYLFSSKCNAFIIFVMYLLCFIENIAFTLLGEHNSNVIYKI